MFYSFGFVQLMCYSLKAGLRFCQGGMARSSRARVLWSHMDWVSLFMPSECRIYGPMGWGFAPCCAALVGAVRGRAGAPELSSTGFSSQNRGAPTPSIIQHMYDGQSYTSLLPHLPLPLIPSNPPHFSPFAPLSPWTPFLPPWRIATKSHLGKETQPRGLLRVGWCASRSNLLK